MATRNIDDDDEEEEDQECVVNNIPMTDIAFFFLGGIHVDNSAHNALIHTRTIL